MANILISTNQTTQQLFSEDNQTMTVDPGVIVTFGSGPAVSSTFGNSTLLNDGFILANVGTANVRAVGFAGDFGVVRNFSDGVISGTKGVYMTSAHAAVVNDGTIIGATEQAVKIEGATKAAVTNTGKIAGRYYGVLFETGGAEGASLVNSGLIQTDVIAVASFLDAGSTMTVTNAAKGVIRGAEGVGTHGGMLVLTNHGKIVGDVLDIPGLKTTVRNDGSIAGVVHLGGGDDKYDGRGGTSGKIYGVGGIDTIIGGSKADWMDGGADRDILTGGKGADRFHFNLAADSAPGATRDFITDFSQGQKDRIDIGDMTVDPFVFRGLAGFSGGGTPSVRYLQVNKPGTANDQTIVQGDADGNGVADFEIALKGLVALKATDFYL